VRLTAAGQSTRERIYMPDATAPLTDLAPPFDELEPMLLLGRSIPFDAPGWTHELKFPGFRILAEVEGVRVRLKTRHGTDATCWFPELRLPLATLGQSRYVLDGEVCVLDEAGRPDLDRLRSRAQRRGYRDGDDPVVYCVFDLLVFRGKDVRTLPLASRKAMLRRVLRRRLPSVQFVQDFPGRGEWLYQQARELHLEGIVSKRLDSPYVSGARSGDWVKVKRPDAVAHDRLQPQQHAAQPSSR
jgi:bifunctional non-homologous end joining protein LigD